MTSSAFRSGCACLQGRATRPPATLPPHCTRSGPSPDSRGWTAPAIGNFPLTRKFFSPFLFFPTVPCPVLCLPLAYFHCWPLGIPLLWLTRGPPPSSQDMINLEQIAFTSESDREVPSAHISGEGVSQSSSFAGSQSRPGGIPPSVNLPDLQTL